ncbi:hypothetical protein HX021_06830 [Sphingobacterium sp. N143]|uniref:hypothetical protein n=1 Tax=Sphingobacterium sp. N143 TaxID=2746727 RepID=UPI002577353F|nr:hypothetical protein [Sphingobacterium sp. N143]MDM1294009.1 hypothetical protein [Sphingobacterium sp. N143]
MQGRFHQYLFNVVGTILISLGWCFGVTQYYSTSYSSVDHQHAVSSSDQVVENRDLGTETLYQGKHHPPTKFRAYFPENDTENDDTGESSAGSDLLFLSGNDFGNLISYFSAEFLNKRVAISLAYLENLSPSKSSLYIHYGVFRL